ncbi:MAG: PQQ-dependent sugar dehydrogenase [Solirubrobacterales bacterium]
MRRAGLATVGWLILLAGGLWHAASAAALPPNFSDRVAISGLNTPTALAFAPDGRVFVAEKNGLIKLYSSLGDPTPSVFADLRTETYNAANRGLLGMTLDPDFPSRPYVYVSYAYDAPIGGIAPKWGTPGKTEDPCPTPPGPSDDGCVVSGRLSRLTATGGTMSAEKVLVNDWCQQYWGHSIGDLAFGADGSLYMSAGDGASYTFTDYGQRGSPLNPCGDPPAGVGGVMSPPTAEGGSLRSQDYRTTGDPMGLDGTVIRVDPDTGRPIPDLPAGSGQSALNRARTVAYGLRNPFRIAVRPGTDEVWVGDVGWSKWEEIDRVEPGAAQPPNFGWPCIEGASLRPRQFSSLELNICNDLYADGTAAAPYFSYEHGQRIDPGERCDEANGSSLSGITFYRGNAGASAFPSAYDGSLFFADFVRNCIWEMPAGGDGLPDPGRVRIFGTAAGPVDLEQGPDGALYYPAIVDGQIRRISYSTDKVDVPPKPQIDAPAAGTHFTARSTIGFSGSASDSEDGPLPGSSLSWTLVPTDCGEELCTEFPIDVDPDGMGGEFRAPADATVGDLRLKLTAIDSAGQTATVSRKLRPRQVTVLLDSKRVGARVAVDDVRGRVPFELGVLKGSDMLISTPLRQNAKGRGKRAKLVWKRWSDGGGRIHYVTARRDRTFVAHYKLKRTKKAGKRGR